MSMMKESSTVSQSCLTKDRIYVTSCQVSIFTLATGDVTKRCNFSVSFGTTIEVLSDP